MRVRAMLQVSKLPCLHILPVFTLQDISVLAGCQISAIWAFRQVAGWPVQLLHELLDHKVRCNLFLRLILVVGGLM